MINYTNPNCRLLESFCEDWPEPDKEEEIEEGCEGADCEVEESVNKAEVAPAKDKTTNASENKTLNEAADDEAEEETEEETTEEVEAEEDEAVDAEEVVKAMEAVLHLDEEGNQVEDEFNEGVNAVIEAVKAIILDAEETEEEPVEEEPTEEEPVEEALEEAAGNKSTYIFMVTDAKNEVREFEQKEITAAEAKQIAKEEAEAPGVKFVHVDKVAANGNRSEIPAMTIDNTGDDDGLGE